MYPLLADAREKEEGFFFLRKIKSAGSVLKIGRRKQYVQFYQFLKGDRALGQLERRPYADLADRRGRYVFDRGLGHVAMDVYYLFVINPS